MKIIKPYIEVLSEIDTSKIMKNIEACGRVCYKSETNATFESADIFVRNIIKRGHESVLEHEKLTVRFVCDRGVSHEIVRHRLASFSQESTRYCNYSNDKFGNELTFIRPCFWRDSDLDLSGNGHGFDPVRFNDPQYIVWRRSIQNAENDYNTLVALGAKPEEARSVLPNSLKTEIIVTMNMRELRHFLKLRTAKAAHPQMREVANMLLEYVKEKLPVLFEDIGEKV